jgi:predicted anti-sigma-YlaC factor YlaD
MGEDAEASMAAPSRGGSRRRLGIQPMKTNCLQRWARLGLVAGLLVITSGGCSIKRMAVNKLGNALAGSGTTFASDDDPELVKAAVPFGLKLMESLLAESPNHKGLLFAASSGFTQYGYAFVQQDADELESKDFAAAEALRARAKRLYLRARDYGVRGLEVAHRGFTRQLAAQPRAAVARLTRRDVPQAYWTAAAWGAAISLAKDDPACVAQIPQMEALIDRALELDESWGEGAIHGFLINYEMGRQGVPGDAAARARQHFERALELTRGRQAGPLVAFAEAVCVEKQNAQQFEELLNRALAINPDGQPETRLVNLVMQRRAKWLLSRKEDLFLTVEKK